MLPPPLRGLADIALTLIVALAIAYVAQAYVIKPYRVPTGSMIPTLEPGDRVLADRLSLHVSEPERGDIVVFHPPACDQPYVGPDGVCTVPQLDARTGETADTTFIKRVIGEPGDTIFTRGGRVWVDPAGPDRAFRMDEPYVHGQPTNLFPTGAPTSGGRIRVPQGHYFMMGDNRASSDDSRNWGPEPEGDILGIARARYWPLDRLGLL